ncbi:uncharacterized protein TNCV_3323851 [Trichonephila clavipes]|nr:uncharacterized protein TNCV_3323851 [Trichonephila clavipes]
MFEKVYVLLDCPTVSSEEIVAVDDDRVCVSPIMAEKRNFRVCSRLKNIVDADSDDKNEVNSAIPIPSSSEMRSIIKWEEATDFVQSIPGFQECDEEDVETWMACDVDDCGYQMLNDDEIVTSVQKESDPVDDETDEYENNNNNGSYKGTSNTDVFSALETAMEWCEQLPVT